LGKGKGMGKFLLTLPLVFILLASGCRVGPKYHPPVSNVPLEWKNSHIEPQMPIYGNNWWDIFQDPLLDELEQLAIGNNRNLRAALDRVLEARAIAGIAGSNLYPQLNLQPIYNNQGVLIQVPRNNSSNVAPCPPMQAANNPSVFRMHQQLYELPFNLSYEVDFWGKIRDQYDFALYNEQAQEWAYQTTLLLLTSDLAEAYFRLRTSDTQIDLFLNTYQNRLKSYDINLARYESKISNYSDVSRAALEVSNAKTDYFEAMRQRSLLENQIAVLIGQPASTFHLAHNPLQIDPPRIPAGIPSDIIRQRPDIAEAERVLAAQNANVGVAVASFYPSLQLTGSLGFLSPDFKRFMEWISRFWAMGANANQTIFDGGFLYYNLQLAKAQYGEAGEIYQQTVLTALQETEDALASIEYLEKEQISSGESVVAAKTTTKISMDRYLNGVAIYLEVTDSQRDELLAERNNNLVLGSRYVAAVQLMKAIGGNFAIKNKTCNY
jgi:multidrug efflux system outer membrane protein